MEGASTDPDATDPPEAKIPKLDKDAEGVTEKPVDIDYATTKQEESVGLQREKDVGISQYVSASPGFSGVLKQRYVELGIFFLLNL